eukprot:8828506-Pyramimonas_sp.AAC.1
MHVYTTAAAYTAKTVCNAAPVYTNRSAGVHHSACVHRTGRRSMYARICCRQLNAMPGKCG